MNTNKQINETCLVSTAARPILVATVYTCTCTVHVYCIHV